MAQFCTKCGSPIPEGMKFCTGCGASVDAPPAPAAPAMAAPVPAAAVAAPMAAAPAPAPMAGVPAQPVKSGSSGMKIVLIIVGVFVFLMLIVAASCAYMIYRAKQKVNQFEKQAQITFPGAMRPSRAGTPSVMPGMPATPGGMPMSPGGESAVQSGPVVDTGVPVYPGADPAGGSGQMSMGGTSVKTQSYLTSDSVDKVTAFYKDKLGSSAMVMASGQQTVIQLTGDKGLVTIGIAPDQASGKTKVSISNMSK